MLFLGFGFKVEIFPLNFWVTDVYEGSSSLVNALFSGIVVKAYLFVFFHLLYLFVPLMEFSTFLVYLGAASMLVAEIVALKQRDLKRVFAYSSLGQVGLIFSVFALGNSEAVTAALFIVLAHSLAKLMIFLSIASIEREHKSTQIATLAELNSPFLKGVMLLAMLSLLGIPPLIGFTGKFLALKSFALGGEFVVMGLILLASLIESVYYFKIAGTLFAKGERRERLSMMMGQKAVFGILALMLIVAGVAPWLFSGFVHEASQAMLDTVAYTHTILGVSK